jgi:hypothetical protein
MLLHSYPNQAHDPEVLQKQLIILCTGRPCSLLRRMSHPVDGLVAQRDFTPSIASVKAWLDEHSGPKVKPPEQRLIEFEEPDRIPPTPEQTEYVTRRLAEVKQVLAETFEAMKKSGKISGRAPKPSQVDCSMEKRLEAIENLQSINSMGEPEDDLSF